jgi:hypothetical protein
MLRQNVKEIRYEIYFNCWHIKIMETDLLYRPKTLRKNYKNKIVNTLISKNI